MKEAATKQSKRITVALYADGAGVGVGVPPVAGYELATKFISIDAFENFAKDMQGQHVHVVFANAFSPRLGRLLLHIRGTQFRQLPAIVIVCDAEPSEEIILIAKGLGCTAVVSKDKFESAIRLIVEEALAIKSHAKLHDEIMARFDTAVLNQDFNEARRSMDRLLLLDERNSYLLPLVTRMFRNDARFDDSGEFVERCALNFPDSPAIRIAVAMLRFDQGRFESAHTILMDMGLKNPTLLSYILINGMGSNEGVEAFSGLSELRKSVYSVRAVRQTMMSWLQTASDGDVSVKKFAKSCLDTLKTELGDRAGGGSEVFGGSVQLEVAPDVVEQTAAISEQSAAISEQHETIEEAENKPLDESADLFETSAFVDRAGVADEVETSDEVVDIDDESQPVAAPDEVLIVSDDGSIEFAMDLGDAQSDVFALPDSQVLASTENKTVATPIAQQSGAAINAATAAAPAANEGSKAGDDKQVADKKPPQAEKKKKGEFEIPDDIRPTAPRPRMPDFSKLLSMLKLHIDTEAKLDKVIANAPDRSVEGRILVYHPHQQGGALLAKNIEDLGCPSVEAVETKADVISRLRSRDIFCLVMWVLPDKEEVSDLLADINFAPGADCKVLMLLSQNHDAIKKVVMARPYLIFDHGCGDTGTRSKIGRALQQAFASASSGPTARQVLSELASFNLSDKNQRNDAKSMLATLEKFPGKKAWTEVLRLEIAIAEGDAGVIKTQRERLEKAYSQFHPAIFAVAKAIYASNEVDAAATYLLKHIMSSRLASPERFFQAGKLLTEWRCENALAFLLQSWTEQKRFSPDQNWNYLMSCYYELRDGASSEYVAPYLLLAIGQDQARYDFWKKLGEKFEADRHYYRAEEVWASIRNLRGADSLYCDLSLAKCYFEGRKVRKADALIQEILRRHPDCVAARDLAHKYRRQIAS